MKLGVSNLAWDRSVEDAAFSLLREYGASGVEVAPTKIAPWEALTPDVLEAYRQKCQSYGLEISSMQAILFNCPDAQLLGDEAGFASLCRQMETVGKVALGLKAGVAVFGAPNNRSKGTLGDADARALALSRMRLLGDIARDHDYVIGIESVPEYYKCDFLNRIADVAAFVRECGHSHVATHFDIACVTLGGDAPAPALEVMDRFVHYHIAEPDLAGFESPKCDHDGVASVLSDRGYAAWAVIEMRQAGPDGLEGLKTALEYATRTYAVTDPVRL
jgi:sugar phosphate isomerase/epimerase